MQPAGANSINTMESAFPRQTVEVLLQLVAGAPCPEALRQKHEQQWKESQALFLSRIGSPAGLGKRSRTDEEEEHLQAGTIVNGSSSKKPKVQTATAAGASDGVAPADASARGEARYTLHAVSLSSPIRKKADITITSSAILLSAPASSPDVSSADLVHPPIPLSTFKRAFLVTNLGKNRNKPHWTVLLLPTDVVDKKATLASQLQLVFSADHAPNVKELFTTTDHTTTSSTRVSHPKGTETLPLLQKFLSFLLPATHLITTPTPNENTASPAPSFTSSFKQPYLDAYRSAKEGSLYFFPSGILWAEIKPAEFFALEDLAPDSDDPSLGGVRTLSATGRTFSLYVRRWIRNSNNKEEKGGTEDEDEDEGILVDETEFSMSDGREQENVLQWLRRYKRLFGVRSSSSDEMPPSQANGKIDKGKGKATAATIAEQDLDDDTDDEDEDFVASSSDDDEESDSSSGEEGGGGRGGEEGSDAAESANDSDGGADDEDVEMEDEEDEMTAERHPLLRPGAMPKMSKAAMDMAVAMVSHDLTSGGRSKDDELEEEEEEGDELDE